MNSTILSLLLSALGPFSGFGGGLLPGLGLGMGSGFGAGSGGVLQPWPGAYGAGSGRGGEPLQALPVQTLALVRCLHQEGMIGAEQAQQLIERQGWRRGWPVDWANSIGPGQVDQMLIAAGGCRPLMAALQRNGSRVVTQPGAAPSWDGNPGHDPGLNPSQGGSLSENEGFGLAPYR
ncbi:hypothetical protein [Cyanobium sp. Morenito 9A2]|uniref:hypothetical protein n=1 Tax=Cyanobium sp. Morenito 9A2 TaxID=2823718 RepID=UPI0020CDEB78|nr:hypothetical protein [Cyanobium sp. Morenito 9A2]MCP9848710.1 hypothetical protein [Cyanobium sp. Morenito 9A2]